MRPHRNCFPSRGGERRKRAAERESGASMSALQPLNRTALVDRLASEPFDVLVIGGGITGAGVALDAAARGFRVALVERRDFASGTSRWSTKLVHGGIRYLPQLDIALVREALVERGRLLRLAPYLVEPLPFVLPLYRFNRHPLGLKQTPPPGPLLDLYIRLGLTAYDVLAGRLNVGRHRRLRRVELDHLAPLLRRDGLLSAYVYYDARTDDARLVLNVLLTAVAHGAVISNYCEVVGFERQHGRLAAAQVRDLQTGREFLVRARVFVNATGIHGEDVARLTGEPPQVSIAPSKGVHLVLPREVVELDEAAVVLPETRDRRLLFIVPWGPRVIFGTTDTGSGPLDQPLPDDADVDYLLEHANQYLLRPLTRRDVISAYAGYRPLIRRGMAESTAQLSRNHELIDHGNGLVSILGGKLTTFRKMAEETVDLLATQLGGSMRHVTRRLPLIGARGLVARRGDLNLRANALGIAASLPTLIHDHGVLAEQVLILAQEQPALAEPLVPGLPYLQAQVAYACRYELAQTIDDVLERRLWVTFADWEHGLGTLERVTDIMAHELGWDAARRQAEIAAYRARVRTLFGSDRGLADDLSAARAASAAPA